MRSNGQLDLQGSGIAGPGQDALRTAHRRLVEDVADCVRYVDSATLPLKPGVMPPVSGTPGNRGERYYDAGTLTMYECVTDGVWVKWAVTAV